MAVDGLLGGLICGMGMVLYLATVNLALGEALVEVVPWSAPSCGVSATVLCLMVCHSCMAYCYSYLTIRNYIDTTTTTSPTTMRKSTGWRANLRAPPKCGVGEKEASQPRLKPHLSVGHQAHVSPQRVC